MIVDCPQCAARYRVDPTQVGPAGVRLRCKKCESVFRVEPAAEAPPPASSAIPNPSAPKPSTDPGGGSSGLSGGETPEPDRERIVLVADSEADSLKATAEALAGWGLQPVMVSDGVEAMLSIQRMLPKLVVLDAALTKMYGFQICEIVKRNESLRSIKVILVGSVHQADRYRRPPAELYGADAYLEKPDVPGALLPYLKQFGFPVSGDEQAAVEAAPAAVGDVAPSSGVVQQPEAKPPPPESGDRRLVDQRATAERLARIVISDIILYNPEKFEAALRSGNVVEALAADLAEGRKLFEQRIDSRVREERDHLNEELLRVAREKGAA